MNVNSDEYFMRIALKQAQIAFENEEVPVGAIITYQDKVIAKGHNLCEKLIDFTAHAEMQVLTSASNYLQNKYLNECTLYVTLEPCAMCAVVLFGQELEELYSEHLMKKEVSQDCLAKLFTQKQSSRELF